ncbi:uncharacterized [Tachysurus ichikawai]
MPGQLHTRSDNILLGHELQLERVESQIKTLQLTLSPGHNYQASIRMPDQYRGEHGAGNTSLEACFNVDQHHRGVLEPQQKLALTWVTAARHRNSR